MRYKTLDALKANAAHDTCAFMMYFLGKTPYKCQEEWGARLDNKEILYEADFEPRDHGKSELFTIAYPLRLLCLNPNIRILIAKNTKGAAIKTLSVIKAQLERNKRIKAFYQPHWMAQAGVDDISNADAPSSDGQSMWGADKVYVKRTEVSQDPTVEAVGVGGSITGGHFDVILLDDVEAPERMKTDQAYLDQIEWYSGTIIQLREPWTKTIVVGTFKRASGDLYEVVRQNRIYSTTIQASILSPALNDITYERILDTDGRLMGVKNIRPKNVKVLCPEKWSIERLIMDREGALTPGTTDNTWRREKMNDLTAFKENIFKREWFRNRYSMAEIQDGMEGEVVRPFFRVKISGWDTAHTEKKTNNKAAFSVGETFGIGPRGYYLLPEFFRAQVEYPDLRRAAVRMFISQRPNTTVIENKDTGISLIQELRRPFQVGEDWISMPIYPYDPDSDKIARANASTSAWESGLVWLPEDCTLDHRHVDCVNSWLPGWIERHLDFPETTWKDDVDVTSMLINYMIRMFPLHGIKRDYSWLLNTPDEHPHSRIIDMQRTLGPAGVDRFIPRHASRVLGVPGRGNGRTVRSLPGGRGSESD